MIRLKGRYSAKADIRKNSDVGQQFVGHLSFS